MLPRLRDRGIVTLAQAERAATAQTSRQSEEAQAGWEAGAQPPGESPVRVDSFPYRHRVRDLMRSPPLLIDRASPLRSVLSQLMENRVSSAFIDQGERGEYGIITERDILRAIDAAGPDALERTAADHGKFPLIAVPKNEFVYRALAEMAGRGFRHLGVVDADERLTGVLSARDLLRQRADDAAALGNAIDFAETPASLGAVWSGLTKAAHALAAEEVDARDIAAIISRELRALTRRACQIAIAEMAAAGNGGPPASFALMVLGSGGRGESMLAMDQDNAILYADGAPEDADGWFKVLGRRVADILAEAGVAYCQGGIMASNAEWRHDLSHWTAQVEKWVGRGRPEDMLNSDIFFDARTVYGDQALFAALRQKSVTLARGSRNFLSFLALRAGEFSSPVGMFGRFKTENGRIDLKMHGIMPIFSAARVAALGIGVEARSTRARLDAMRESDAVSERAIDNLIEAHGILLDLILRQQLRDIPRGVALSNKVAPAELPDFEKDRLKWAIEQIPRIDGLLGIPSVGR